MRQRMAASSPNIEMRNDAMIESRPDLTIENEACRWAVALDLRPLRAEEQRELEAWLSADARHVGALALARAHWWDLDRVAALAGPSAHDVQDDVDHRRRYFLAASVAGAAAAGLAGYGLWVRGDERYRTAVGEMRRVALMDGSVVSLNTDSELRVDFRPESRTLRLQRGEALFDVAHHPARPFIVIANEVRVRAIGTVFAVRVGEHKVNVTVSEGVVELANGSTPTRLSAPQRVAANQQSVVEPAAPAKVSRIAPEVVERRLAWVNGMVAFEGEPLEEAVQEVNRHSQRRIVVADQWLSAQPIVGLFRATDAEGFCRTAAAALGATVVDEGDAIYLRRDGGQAMAP